MSDEVARGEKPAFVQDDVDMVSALSRRSHNVGTTNALFPNPQKNVETKVITGNEAFNEAKIQDPPSPWCKQMLLIYLFSTIGFCW